MDIKLFEGLCVYVCVLVPELDIRARDSRCPQSFCTVFLSRVSLKWGLSETWLYLLAIEPQDPPVCTSPA